MLAESEIVSNFDYDENRFHVALFTNSNTRSFASKVESKRESRVRWMYAKRLVAALKNWPSATIL